MSISSKGNHMQHSWLQGAVGLPKCVQRSMEQHITRGNVPSWSRASALARM